MDNKTIFERFQSITRFSNDTLIPVDVMTRVLNLAMLKYGEISEKQLVDAVNEFDPSCVDTLFGHSRFVGIEIAENFRDHLRNEDAAKIETGMNDYVRKFKRRDPILRIALEENFGATHDGSGVVESKKMLGILYAWLNNNPKHNRLRSLLSSGNDFVVAVHAFLGAKVEQTIGKNFIVRGITNTKKYINGVLVPEEPSESVNELNLGILKQVFEAHNVSKKPALIKPEPKPVAKPAAAEIKPAAVKKIDTKPAEITVAAALRNNVSAWRVVITSGLNEFCIWMQGKLFAAYEDNAKVTQDEITKLIKYYCTNIKSPSKTLAEATEKTISDSLNLLKDLYTNKPISNKSSLISKFVVKGTSYHLPGYKLSDDLVDAIKPAKSEPVVAPVAKPAKAKIESKPLFDETRHVEKEIVNYKENLVNTITLFVQSEFNLTKGGTKIDTHKVYDAFMADYAKPRNLTCGYILFCKYLRKALPYGYVTLSYGNVPSYLVNYEWKDSSKNADIIKPEQKPAAEPVKVEIKPAELAKTKFVSRTGTVLGKLVDVSYIKPAEQPKPVEVAKHVEQIPVMAKLTVDKINKMSKDITGAINMLDGTMTLNTMYTADYSLIDNILKHCDADRVWVKFNTVMDGYDVRIIASKIYGSDKSDVERGLKLTYAEKNLTIVENEASKVFKFKAKTGVQYFDMIVNNMLNDVVKIIHHYANSK